MAKNIVRTRPGRAMQAVRDRDVAAEVVGVNLARYKVGAFVLSSAYAAWPARCTRRTREYVTARLVGLLLSIQFIAIIIVGGVGTIFGSILGAILFTVLPRVDRERERQHALRECHGTGGGLTVQSLNQVLFGLLIIFFLVLEPLGLAEVWLRITRTSRPGRSRIDVYPVPEDVPMLLVTAHSRAMMRYFAVVGAVVLPLPHAVAQGARRRRERRASPVTRSTSAHSRRSATPSPYRQAHARRPDGVLRQGQRRGGRHWREVQGEDPRRGHHLCQPIDGSAEVPEDPRPGRDVRPRGRHRPDQGHPSLARGRQHRRHTSHVRRGVGAKGEPPSVGTSIPAAGDQRRGVCAH